MDNMDIIVEMCRQAVADIIRSVGGVGDLLQDENRMALITGIAKRLEQLGADVNAILGTELANAYFQGITDADAFLSSDGIDTEINGINRQVHLAGVESIVADTMQDMSASFRTALMTGITNIDDILTSVNQDIAKGMILGDPSGVVSRMVEQTFAQNGMTAFITKDGKKLPLDFYAQTVTRTKYRVAHTTGATNRYKESGVYHVKIDEHHPTCQHCAKFQGMVIALDPDNAQGFPVAGEGTAKLPPYHPNCQHTARPYVMDFHSKNDIANEKKKWRSFDPDKDTRTDDQKKLYKSEQDIRRKARQEMKEYDLMKATLKGDDLDKLPKTLGAYRRLKRKGDAKWQELQQAYKDQSQAVASAGPTDPGTPRKRKGSNTGSSPAPKKSTPKKQVQPKQTKQTNEPVSTVSTKSKGPELTKRDQNAHNIFDQRIDGIQFADRRKTAKHIIDNMPGSDHVKIGIRNNIGANGYCAFGRTHDRKIHIPEYVLLKDDPRPDQYKWKTMFHEYFHLNANGLDYPPGGLDNTWTRWEETATECSAFFMADRSGIDVTNITPSYSDHLIETLPRLKQLDEFKDCESLKDFGAIFMKYRFDPSSKLSDWTPIRTQAMKQKWIDPDKYFADNYLQYVSDNVDRYTDMIFDSLTQDDKFRSETMIRGMVKRGLEDGIKNKRVTREIRMIMPILFNEAGVKIP